MGLKDTAKKVAQDSLKAAGDVLVDVTMTTGATKTHDAENDTVSYLGGTTATVKALRYSNKTREQGTVVRRNMILFSILDLEEAGLNVTQETILTIGAITYKFIDLERDPAEAVLFGPIEPGART